MRVPLMPVLADPDQCGPIQDVTLGEHCPAARYASSIVPAVETIPEVRADKELCQKVVGTTVATARLLTTAGLLTVTCNVWSAASGAASEMVAKQLPNLREFIDHIEVRPRRSTHPPGNGLILHVELVPIDVNQTLLSGGVDSSVVVALMSRISGR
jgi:hypothetical protein